MRRVRSLVPLLSAAFLLVPLPIAAGPWRASAHNSEGWQWMTPQERVEHQRRIRGFTDYDACLAYLAEHHAEMAERARLAGARLAPRGEAGCERLRAGARTR